MNKNCLLFIDNRKRMLVFIFLIAFTLRIGSVAAIAFVRGITYPDDHEYGVIARLLLKGEGYSVPVFEILGDNDQAIAEIRNYFFYLRSYIPEVKPHYGLGEKELFEKLKETGQYSPTADQLPFYPIVLAVIYFFSSSPLSSWIVKFLQAIFSSATCIIIYLIAFKLFNKRTAMIAGLISVIYPAFILEAYNLTPETFFTFWLALTVFYLIILKGAPSLKHSLIAGALIGITLLNSNVAVPMIPFIGVWMLTLNGTWKARSKIFLLAMFTAFLIVSPWLVRNYFVFNAFPLMKTAMGINFWLGNNPSATGTFFQASGERMEFMLQRPFNEDFKLSEAEQDKRLYNEAMGYVKENPMHFVRLFLKRFYYFTWFPPDTIISNEGRIYKSIFKIPYGFILMSCAAGIILFSRKNAKDTFLLCAIMFSVVVLYSIFIVGHMRYRMPIEPYMILFTAFAIGSLFEKHSRRFRQ